MARLLHFAGPFFHSNPPFTMKLSGLLLSTFASLIVIGTACGPSTPASDEVPSSATAQENQLDTLKYTRQGMEIAMGTFKALSGQLKAAMQEGGVQHAVQYCNTVAYPLVDSLSGTYGATIRRASNKARNPKDEPTELEATVINAYQNDLNQGTPLKPHIQQLASGEIAFFAPITTQDLCLKCHGKLGETLAVADYAVIKDLYPADDAIGYASGELRGVWSIAFPAE